MPVTSADAAYAWALALDLSVPSFGDVPNSDEPLPAFFLAGWDGDFANLDGSSPADASLVDRAAFERSTGDEFGDLTFAVIAQSGRSDGDDLTDARSASSTVLDEFSAALVADPTMGGAVSDSWVSAVATFTARTEDGALVRRLVTVSYETLR